MVVLLMLGAADCGEYREAQRFFKSLSGGHNSERARRANSVSAAIAYGRASHWEA
jgi:hypothetical protein